MTEQSPQRSAEPDEAPIDQNPEPGSGQVGLLILAAIALVAALLAGTLLFSRSTDAAPSEPTVVTVTANSPSSKSYPSYTPTGPRYTPSPIVTPTQPTYPVEPQRPTPATSASHDDDGDEDEDDENDDDEPGHSRTGAAERPAQTRAAQTQQPERPQTVVITQTRR